tara:strand:- start:4381 stop:4836 length:456 start_codon:yes stop_codon:yes gene_type:complete
MIDPAMKPFVAIAVIIAIVGLMYFMGVFSSNDTRENTGDVQRQSVTMNKSRLTNQANRKEHFETAPFNRSGVGRPTLFTERGSQPGYFSGNTFAQRGPDEPRIEFGEGEDRLSANTFARTEFKKIGASSRFDKPFSMNNPRPIKQAYASKN